MVFTSREYILFLVVVVATWCAISTDRRWALLLVASYVFYAMGEPAYALPLVATSFAAYAAGIVLESTTSDARRRLVFIVALVLLFAPLVVLKYGDFLVRSATDLFARQDDSGRPSYLDLLLPLGISFFTFQTAGYLIDIYQRRFRAERHFGRFALYVSFFPQLIAGPIERAQRLLPQLRQTAPLDPQRTVSGLRLILWGAFKKLVIADNLAIYVDAVYRDPTSYSGLPLLVATLFFAIQIYCDFSGYVDIARGTARIFGIELMRNFDRPYGAASIGEFWHRWHISLSSWFRDYLYIPLGGNRHGVLLQSRNVMIVFLVSGLWHGANWTFVLWGALHGSYLLLSLWTARWRAALANAIGLADRRGLHRAVQIAVTFVLVTFAWVFFRSASVGDAFYVVTHMLAPGPAGSDMGMSRLLVETNGSEAGLIVMTMLAGSIVASHLLPADSVRLLLRPGATWLRWGVYYAMLTGILFGGAVDLTPFIYFRF